MRKLLTITPEKIEQVKELLKKNTIREAGRMAEVSYYTAWCISKGKYDNQEPLQDFMKYKVGRCPITGYLL